MNELFSLKIKKWDLEIEVSGSNENFVITNYEKALKYVEESNIFQPNIINKPQTEKIEIIQTQNEMPSISDSIQTPQNKLADSVWIELDQLCNIYDFSNWNIAIHTTIEWSTCVQQQIITKLALIAELLINDNESLTGKAIWKYLSDLWIWGTWNLATNLKKEKWIIKIKSSYKLNTLWKKETYELIKTLSNID